MVEVEGKLVEESELSPNNSSNNLTGLKFSFETSTVFKAACKLALSSNAAGRILCNALFDPNNAT